MMRLNRYLATCGICSRRKAEKYILDGRVTVNGTKTTDLSTTVNEYKDSVKVDGKRAQIIQKKIYFVLNKPKGFVTTASDEQGRKTIFNLLKIEDRVFPVGRLDYNSEGLLLLTNDGEMAHRLMHPKFKVPKTYRVRLNSDFKEADFEKLTSGLELDDGLTSPCKAYYYTTDKNRVEIQLREGKKHQVRRMFSHLGYEVETLKRTQYGPIQIKTLARGKWRPVFPGEIRQLRKATGLLDKNAKQ